MTVTADNAPAHLNLGEAYQEQKRPDDALAEYRKVLQLDPTRHEAYNNIARLLNDQGRASEALNYCQAAVALDPKSAPSHTALGIVLAELGRSDQAMKEFSAAARLDAADPASHFQMARTLLKQVRDVEAVAQFREALRIDPNNFQILISAARVLAADENPEARNGAEAVALAGRAAQLAGTPQPVVLDTLAMACAEAGRFEDAAGFAQQAAQLAETAGAKDDAAEMRQRLELYRRHQPWRKSFRAP